MWQFHSIVLYVSLIMLSVKVFDMDARLKAFEEADKDIVLSNAKSFMETFNPHAERVVVICPVYSTSARTQARCGVKYSMDGKKTRLEEVLICDRLHSGQCTRLTQEVDS